MAPDASPLSIATADALAQIQAVVGPAGWIEDSAMMAGYLTDERGHFHGAARAVVRPASTQEVSTVVTLCRAARIAIVPQGGNTGLCGGATPDRHGDAIVLSLGRMNRIRALDPLDDTITVEAGCVLAEIQRAAETADRLFPLSLAAEGSCQIGGNLSTTAGGIQVLRYGMARDLVLGLEVVLPDGQVWSGLRALRKDNTGYDLKQLFIGAEGTLGIITAAVLKLFARPREVETAFAAVRDPAAAIALLARLKALSGEGVTAFELIGRPALDLVFKNTPGTTDPLSQRHDWYVLVELSGGDRGGALRATLEATLAAAIEEGLVLDAAVAQSGPQAQALWRLRESCSEAQKPEGASIKHDVSVPVSRVPQFLAAATEAVQAAMPGARVVAFGHAGDGNIHFNLCQPVGEDGPAFLALREKANRLVHDLVMRLGGSISAEHGIGQLKREELQRYKAPLEIELMRTLKRAFDPLNLMNPGKVI